MAILLSKALFGDEEGAAMRDFLQPEGIKQSVRSSKNYRLDGTDPDQAALLLLFDTRMQRTWLVKTTKRLYCVLDDLREREPNVNWSMPVQSAVENGTVTLDIRNRGPSDTGKSGLIDFGVNHRDWLYSPRLFTVRPVDEEIRDFLMK
ncbi:MAG: hypothetical protein KF914_18255 [Rhizobiaceae bacterium]|nr:hypothetical protein [Rhizobiaceae bacterium]